MPELDLRLFELAVARADAYFEKVVHNGSTHYEGEFEQIVEHEFVRLKLLFHDCIKAYKSERPRDDRA